MDNNFEKDKEIVHPANQPVIEQAEVGEARLEAKKLLEKIPMKHRTELRIENATVFYDEMMLEDVFTELDNTIPVVVKKDERLFELLKYYDELKEEYFSLRDREEDKKNFYRVVQKMKVFLEDMYRIQLSQIEADISPEDLRQWKDRLQKASFESDFWNDIVLLIGDKKEKKQIEEELKGVREILGGYIGKPVFERLHDQYLSLVNIEGTLKHILKEIKEYIEKHNLVLQPNEEKRFEDMLQRLDVLPVVELGEATDFFLNERLGEKLQVSLYVEPFKKLREVSKPIVEHHPEYQNIVAMLLHGKLPSREETYAFAKVGTRYIGYAAMMTVLASVIVGCGGSFADIQYGDIHLDDTHLRPDTSFHQGYESYKVDIQTNIKETKKQENLYKFMKEEFRKQTVDSLWQETLRKNQVVFDRLVSTMYEKSGVEASFASIDRFDDLQNYISSIDVSEMMILCGTERLIGMEKESKEYVIGAFQQVMKSVFDVASRDKKDPEALVVAMVKDYFKKEFRHMLEKITLSEVVLEKDMPLYVDKDGNMRVVFEYFNKTAEPAVNNYRRQDLKENPNVQPRFGMDYRGWYEWQIIEISADGQDIKVYSGEKNIPPEYDFDMLRNYLHLGFDRVRDKTIDEIIEHNLWQLRVKEQMGKEEEKQKELKPEEKETLEKELPELQNPDYMFTLKKEGTRYEKIFSADSLTYERNKKEIEEMFPDLVGAPDILSEMDYGEKEMLKKFAWIKNAPEYFKALDNVFDFSHLPGVHERNYAHEMVAILMNNSNAMLDLLGLMEKIGKDEVIHRIQDFSTEWGLPFSITEVPLAFFCPIVEHYDEYERNKQFLKEDIGFSLKRYISTVGINTLLYKYSGESLAKIFIAKDLQNKIYELEKLLGKEVLVRHPKEDVTSDITKSKKRSVEVSLNSDFKEDFLYRQTDLLDIDFNNARFKGILDELKMNLKDIEKKETSEYLLTLYSFSQSDYYDAYEKYVAQFKNDFPDISFQKYQLDDIDYNPRDWENYNKNNIDRYIHDFPQEALSVNQLQEISKYYDEGLSTYVKTIGIKVDDPLWKLSKEVLWVTKYHFDAQKVHDNFDYLSILVDGIMKDPNYISGSMEETGSELLNIVSQSDVRELEKRVESISKPSIRNRKLSFVLGYCKSFEDFPHYLDSVKNNISFYEELHHILNSRKFGYKKMNPQLKSSLEQGSYGEATGINIPSSLLIEEGRFDPLLDKEVYNRTITLLNTLSSQEQWQKRNNWELEHFSGSGWSSYNPFQLRVLIKIAKNIDTFENIVKDFEDIYQFSFLSSDFSHLYQHLDRLLMMYEKLGTEKSRERLTFLKKIHFVPSDDSFREERGLYLWMMDEEFWTLAKNTNFCNFVDHMMNLATVKKWERTIEYTNSSHLSFIKNAFKNLATRQYILDLKEIRPSVIQQLEAVKKKMSRQREDGFVSSSSTERLTSVEVQHPADLLMVHMVLHFLEKPENRDFIGKMLVTDYNDKTTEYGGGIELSSKGAISFVFDTPEASHLGDAGYNMSDAFEKRLDEDFIFLFHFHAVQDTSFDISELVGASGGGIFGGDLTAARKKQINEIVITLLPGDEFNVQFFGPTTARLKVIDCGNYRFTPPKGIQIPKKTDENKEGKGGKNILL